MRIYSPILIAEDNAAVRTLMARVVSMHGLTPLEADMGVTAIQLAMQHTPALIILDLAFPDMDGVTVAKRLRAQRHLATVPILAVTGMAIESIIDAAQAAGCTQILQKPFSLTTFEAAITALLAVPA